MTEVGQVVKVLTDLLENAREREHEFRASAKELDIVKLKTLLNNRASGYVQAAHELEQLIMRCDTRPPEGGSAVGALHRGWVKVKGAVGANSQLSILEMCVRGEESSFACYQRALKEALPADVRIVIEDQSSVVQRNCEQFRNLCDAAR